MKIFLLLILTILSFNTFANNRLYSECEGLGGPTQSNDEIAARFKIDDQDKTIKVYFDDKDFTKAIYKIYEDSTSQSYRRGEQILRGLLISGSTPFGTENAKHITVWVPNTYYYGNTFGSMSFAPKNWGIGTNIVFVQMSCL